MEKKIDYVRIRDGNKVYGWLFDPSKPDKVCHVRLTLPGGEKVQLAADKPLPEWARKMVAGSAGRTTAAVAPTAHGYFEYQISARAIDGYGEIGICDFEDDRPLSGSPLVAYGQQDVEGTSVAASRFVGIPDENVTHLDYRQFRQRVREAQRRGLQVVVHPPFISWNIPLFQRPQHLALAFARAGAVSVYFTDNHLDNINSVVTDSDRFFIAPPEYFETFLADINDTNIILYSTSPQPIIDKVISSGNRLVYEYVDHIDPKISAGWLDGCVANQAALGDESAYAVIATAKLLEEEMLERFDRRRVGLVPNGVSCAHFAVERDETTIPSSYRSVVSRRRPIVGYYGAIAPWLDYALIDALAARVPEVDFVYIGPLYLKGADELPRRDNLFWYGQVDYTDLPHYAVWFDVCFIPFEPGQIAATTSPLKLFEYFSLGKPVVVTSAMKECVQFPIVRSGVTAGDIAKQIRDVLANWSDADATASRELAREHDWQRRAEHYLEFLAGLEQEEPVPARTIDMGDVFVAPIAGAMLTGALAVELAGEELVFQTNGARLRPGNALGWRLKLPQEVCAEGGVLSLEFRMVFAGAANSAVCRIECGDEWLEFAPYTDSRFKTVRMALAAGRDEVVIRVTARSELHLTVANTQLRTKAIAVLTRDEQVYCNIADIRRSGEVVAEAEHGKAHSVMGESTLTIARGTDRSASRPDRTVLSAPQRPTEISLVDNPVAGEFVELEADMRALTNESARAVRIKLCAPHYNPQGLGRVFYFVAIDDEVVYHEDVSAYSGLNEIVVRRPREALRIGVLASDQAGNWKWQAASRVQIFDLELIEDEPAVPCKASSPAGVVLDEPVARAEFLREMSVQPKVGSEAKERHAQSKKRSKNLARRALSAIRETIR